MQEQLIRAHRRLELNDMIWLVYTVFLLIEPVYRHSLLYWLQTLAVIAVFVGVYVRFLVNGRLRVRLALLTVMFLMGIVLYPWNEGAPAFMIYSAALLPLTIPSLPWILAAVAVELTTLVLVGWSLHLPAVSYCIDAVLLVMACLINVFAAQRMRADCKLRLKQEEIEALAAVAERERIARDLHDVLGHTLSVIALKSELAGRLLESELSSSNLEAVRRARTEVGDVEQAARVALAEVREAIGGYRARGLGAEIEAARQTLATAGVILHTNGDVQPTSMTAAEETVLALALREAVTNIVRHARATECHLSLLRSEGHYRLSVQDNGHHADSREGNGLRGMRERIEALGGQLSLQRENGTHLLIELPPRPA